jgi:hypothetical protein
VADDSARAGVQCAHEINHAQERTNMHAETLDRGRTGSKGVWMLSTRTWIALVLADVVVWLVADSQGPDFLAFNATGTFLHVLQGLWVVSLLAFIVLVLLGVSALVKSRLSRAR